MEEKHFTEKESLDVMTQMLQQTKRKLEIGGGNTFLFYGYTSVFVSIVVFLMTYFTHHPQWHLLWLLMFVPLIVERITRSKRQQPVITYFDKAVKNIWLVICLLLVLSALTILAVNLILKITPYNFTLMMPLSLLLIGIGVSTTGIILTNQKKIMYFTIPNFILSIYMLVIISSGGHPVLIWNLLAGLGFLIMLVIPGHILNHQASKQCSKN